MLKKTKTIATIAMVQEASREVDLNSGALRSSGVVAPGGGLNSTGRGGAAGESIQLPLTVDICCIPRGAAGPGRGASGPDIGAAAARAMGSGTPSSGGFRGGGGVRVSGSGSSVSLGGADCRKGL